MWNSNRQKITCRDTYIYKKEDAISNAERTKEEKEKEERRKKEEERTEAAQEITERHRQLRWNFAKSRFRGAKLGDVAILWEHAAKFFCDGLELRMCDTTDTDDEYIRDILTTFGTGEEGETLADVARNGNDADLCIALLMFGHDSEEYYRRRYESGLFITYYCENKELDAVYDMLEDLGYHMSDEEKQMRDGTHPVFDAEKWEAAEK